MTGRFAPISCDPGIIGFGEYFDKLISEIKPFIIVIIIISIIYLLAKVKTVIAE